MSAHLIAEKKFLLNSATCVLLVVLFRVYINRKILNYLINNIQRDTLKCDLIKIPGYVGLIIPESDDMFLFFRERVTESFGPCETPQTWRRQTRLNRLGPNGPGIRCVPRHDAAQFSCTSARSRLAAGDRHTYAPTTITQDSLSLSLLSLLFLYLSRSLIPVNVSVCRSTISDESTSRI